MSKVLLHWSKTHHSHWLISAFIKLTDRETLGVYDIKGSAKMALTKNKSQIKFEY